MTLLLDINNIGTNFKVFLQYKLLLSIKNLNLNIHFNTILNYQDVSKSL